jgi:hypothetical protein
LHELDLKKKKKKGVKSTLLSPVGIAQYTITKQRVKEHSVHRFIILSV